jgi:hypothetical protein
VGYSCKKNLGLQDSEEFGMGILLISLIVPVLLAVLVYSLLLFINVIPIKSTDLSKVSINGYFIHQKISDDMIQSDFDKLKHRTYEYTRETYDLFS